MAGEPYTKESQLARGERRYMRKVASPKQWQAIIEAKRGPCRICGRTFTIEFHHTVQRIHGGHDVADNIVPLCKACHGRITARNRGTCKLLLSALTDAEYAYMIQHGGEDYPERAYGIRYTR